MIRYRLKRTEEKTKSVFYFVDWRNIGKINIPLWYELNYIKHIKAYNDILYINLSTLQSVIEKLIEQEYNPETLTIEIVDI